MEAQNGQAAATVSAPVAISSSARAILMRLPFSSPRNICPPPAPQQNDLSRLRGASTRSADRPRSSSAHRKCRGNGPGSRDRDRPFSRALRQPEWAVAPCGGRAIRNGARSGRSVPASRQSCSSCGRSAGRCSAASRACAADVLDIFFRERGEKQIVAEAPRGVAVALFFLQNAERDAEMSEHFNQRENVSRPPGRRRPCSPARGNIPGSRHKSEARPFR